MRAYLIDEIRPEDMDKVRAFLSEHATSSSLQQIFWVRIPDDLLSALQLRHESCRPHVFAVETGSDWVKMEFFVRSSRNMRCTCPAYCTAQQRAFVIRFADSMVDKLAIQT